MKLRNCVLLLVFPLLLLPACGEEEDATHPIVTGDLQGRLISATDCKSFLKSSATAFGASGESAVLFTYDAAEAALHLTHVNAGFNCCPGELSVTVSVADGTFTIAEHERGAACHCNCLFDLDILVENIGRAQWRIVFDEPYRADVDPVLDFHIDLTKEVSGEHRVPRTRYPWGM